MRDLSGRKQQGVVSPCAACKLLRRRCAQDCIFAPHFPADEPQKFANVHKVFGASNVNKMLQEIPSQHRSDAVSSLVYEANARVRDPVYGCVGAISTLQHQIDVLRTQLAVAQAEVVHLKVSQQTWLAALSSSKSGCAGFGGKEKHFEANDHKAEFGMDVVAAIDGGDMMEPMWSC